MAAVRAMSFAQSPRLGTRGSLGIQEDCVNPKQLHQISLISFKSRVKWVAQTMAGNESGSPSLAYRK